MRTCFLFSIVTFVFSFLLLLPSMPGTAHAGVTGGREATVSGPSLAAVAPAPRCADLNGDGRVNWRDLVSMFEAVERHSHDATFDIDNNGRVDWGDFWATLRQIGRRCYAGPPPTNTPTPRPTNTPTPRPTNTPTRRPAETRTATATATPKPATTATATATRTVAAPATSTPTRRPTDTETPTDTPTPGLD